MQERIASAEIKAALTGIVPDPSAVADDLNLAKFVTAEGDVDAAAISALREKYQAFAPTNGARVPEPTPGTGCEHATPPRSDHPRSAGQHGPCGHCRRSESRIAERRYGDSSLTATVRSLTQERNRFSDRH